MEIKVGEGTAIDQSSRIAGLTERLCTDKISRFFGLTPEEISEVLGTVKFTRGGVSPIFLSPGFGDNQTDSPQIRSTFLSNRTDADIHEAMHVLHYAVCKTLFQRSNIAVGSFSRFKDSVLGDSEFIADIKKKGSKLQNEFLESAVKLSEKEGLSPNEIMLQSTVLGALTFQHAHFVDARMCEAVGSFENVGITKAVGHYNRAVSSLIPYHANLALKGYGDRESQSMFKQAGMQGKALLIRRTYYSREQFFRKEARDLVTN